MEKQPLIYCPKCEYRPQPEDRWHCVPTCENSWHTFWTGGVCPSCGFHWQVTQCPACARVSPHAHWYHDPLDDPQAEREQVLEHK